MDFKIDFSQKRV